MIIKQTHYLMALFMEGTHEPNGNMQLFALSEEGRAAGYGRLIFATAQSLQGHS